MSDTAPASSEATAPAATNEPAVNVPEVKDEVTAKEEPKPDQEASKEEAKPAEGAADVSAEKPKTEESATADGDVEMKEATEAAGAAAETPNSKSKNNRRKSVGGTLNRKGSKARLTHTDAKPGDHFLVKLKGFPPWPVIICDETMLPQPLITSRPVSAARPDGSYTEAYAEGGKRMHDRTFPIMYLFTNEFGWVANTNLTVLTEEKAKSSINDKMRKDLKAAFELAAEQNPIEHYKDVLQKFEEELIAQEEAIEEARRAKEAAKEAAREAKEAATPKKGKKAKAKGNEDEDMADADGSAKPKSKKRKADEEANTPQRSDSVKKPKIKIHTPSTNKSANGTPSKKEDAGAKKAKPKAKEDKKPKEVKMSEAEKRERKQKEVFFLRHKLQKGLLGKDTGIDEAELEGLSHYLDKLKEFTDLEASIIRETKINKVLKAILKLEHIPREAEFNFKSRSQALLDKWNKLLANAAAAAPAPTATSNGVNGASKPQSEEKKEANGNGDETESKKADSEKPVADGEPEAAKAEEKQEPAAAATSEPVAAAE